VGVTMALGHAASDIAHADGQFRVTLDGALHTATALVLATGGPSIPRMGATGFAYDVARRFGVPVTETRPGLVPLTFETGLLAQTAPLAGVSTPSVAAGGGTRFAEALLFTHRGLSGPAILQVSSYWREGQEIALDMAPGVDLYGEIRAARAEAGRQSPVTALARRLPRRLAQWIADTQGAASGNLADLSDARLKTLAAAINAWTVKPVGSEGYRTAEVTVGGIDTAALNSRTLMAEGALGLHFIGEAVDVTGWLGGYNFQWAWASGWCAGQAV